MIGATFNQSRQTGSVKLENCSNILRLHNQVEPGNGTMGYPIEQHLHQIRKLYRMTCITRPTKKKTHDTIYSSSLILPSFSTGLLNFRRMFVRAVRSSTFSGARPPFFRMPSSLLNSFSRYALSLPAFSTTFT